MGKIFKTPKDDSVEETLRAMHLANTVDNVYEWGYGWVRTIIVSVVSVLTVSATELYYDVSLWSITVEWFLQKVADFGNWLVGLVS
tara:strand:- start:6791 stop:7048 length:258 start_codon:yes stop_codon:yes gene_type:complete